MPQGARAALAVVFVTALGIALAIPLIRASDSSNAPRSARSVHTPRSHSPAPNPTHSHRVPSPPPSPSGTLPEVVLGIGSHYPRACEHPATPVPGTGEIAAFTRGKGGNQTGEKAGITTIADIDGTVVARFVSDASLRWSPSAKFLLNSAGHLWTSSGRDKGPLFPPGSEDAAWLPTSDCAFAVSHDRTRLYVARPGHDAIDLVDGHLQAFSISDDGSHLAVATSVTSTQRRVELASIDLSHHRAASYLAPEGACCVVFASTWFDNSSPLLWLSPGVSVAADGWKLQALRANAHGRAKLEDVANPIIPSVTGYVARCGDALVVVSGGGRPYPTISNKRLESISPDGATKSLTPHGEVYQRPSCSNDGAYIAAIAAPEKTRGDDGHVAIVSSDGGVLQRLTSGSDLADYNPEWGPPGTGVLFGRRAGGQQWTLWFAPEGSSPHSTGIRTASYAYDWSATPPTGVP